MKSRSRDGLAVLNFFFYSGENDLLRFKRANWFGKTLFIWRIIRFVPNYHRNHNFEKQLVTGT